MTKEENEYKLISLITDYASEYHLSQIQDGNFSVKHNLECLRLESEIKQLLKQSIKET